ncbi:Hsp20/alpha crystallin family protein [Streptomyces sp. DH37]|uniref:Hsp20/alpha crystallin family protein n=1 Tax=Streptomyces sp. DH37 TaxID=3040122 RepID=UPI00244369AA|nr:Hsp20/alpha crystallin family protein [Streptomyces sp. DH37]MDG9702899.1 Hsp20/alpha crystallin family protein [Streptomyces sp. DH37]
MVMRTDPFRELDRLTQRLLGAEAAPAGVPMDAWREGDAFWVRFDLPGVNPDSIDLSVERDVLTLRAERSQSVGEQAEVLVNERPVGTFTRQLFLGEALDTEHIDAAYDAGVLTLRVPAAEQVKPRKIPLATGGERHRIEQ